MRRERRSLFVDTSSIQGMVRTNTGSGVRLMAKTSGGTELVQRTPEFSLFAAGFHLAAKDIVRELRHEQSFGSRGLDDFRAYPVVFLYRHALELQLKSVIHFGAGMVALKGRPAASKKALVDHQLIALLDDVEQVFAAYEWSWDMGVDHARTREDFRRIVTEFHDVDSRSFAFRYPIGKDGSPSQPPMFSFSLFAFAECLDPILEALGSYAYAAYEEFQNECEMLFEQGQDQMDHGDGE